MASSSLAGPSATTPASTLAILTNLPIFHPSFGSLLVAHTPLASSSSLPHQPLNKLLGRINTAILSRESENDRRIAWTLAREVILQDTEGFALLQFGKGWVTASIAAVTATSQPSASAVLPVRLLASIIFAASTYPSFEREAIHPVMGKVAVSLSRLLERGLVEGDWNSFGDIAPVIKSVLQHSPASFRPITPNMRNLLRAVTLSLPPPSVIPEAATTVILAPWEIRHTSADLLSALPVTAGKAQSPAAWGVAMRESLGGIGEALNGITKEGWEEEAIKVTPPATPAGLPALPADPATRLAPSLDWLEGFTEEALALLRYPTSRPVPIPIAQIVSAGLRCLNLTLDTPAVAYVSPLHHAALLSALPRIWTAGMLLLAGVATACGDHLLPHLSGILDHSVWLLERTPLSMHQTQLQLLQFHHMLFTLYPPALAPVDYPTRLLRSCLSRYSAIISSDRPTASASLAASVANGKRGKKRARGAEDGLIGGLEGRESRAASQDTVQAVVASLRLAALLHSTPLLAPSLLTFSIRLHLSLYIHLLTTSASSFESPLHLSQLREGARKVLEGALCLVEGEQGTSRGWKSAVLSVLNTQGDRIALLLHPSVPPAHRPQPPLNALHYFTKETEEERKLRRELGYSTLEDALVPGEDKEDHDMTVGQPTAQIFVPSVTPSLPKLQPIGPPPTVAQTTVQTLSEVVKTTSSAAPMVARIATTPQHIAAPPSEPAAPAVAAVEPFIATSASKPRASSIVETVTQTVTEQRMDVDDDEPLPDLDSGSSDEDGDDDDEDDDEDGDEA